MVDVAAKFFVKKCTEHQPKCCYWPMLMFHTLLLSLMFFITPGRRQLVLYSSCVLILIGIWRRTQRFWNPWQGPLWHSWESDSFSLRPIHSWIPLHSVILTFLSTLNRTSGPHPWAPVTGQCPVHNMASRNIYFCVPHKNNITVVSYMDQRWSPLDIHPLWQRWSFDSWTDTMWTSDKIDQNKAMYTELNQVSRHANKFRMTPYLHIYCLHTATRFQSM